MEVIVKRKETNEELFFFSSLDLIYSLQYKDIKIKIPRNKTFGIGERNSKQLELQDGTFTLWNQRNVDY